MQSTTAHSVNADGDDWVPAVSHETPSDFASSHPSRHARPPFDAAMTSPSDGTYSPRRYQQTWFGVVSDVLQPSSPARSSLSPLPLTTAVNSLYLPYNTGLASPGSDDSDTASSPPDSLPSSSPPPQLATDELGWPATTALYSLLDTSAAPPRTVSAQSPSAQSVVRKRVKADDSERAARAERKRRRHRAIDLSRRKRESAAVQQLYQLVQGTSGRADDSAAATTGDSQRADKVSILEQAVAQLSELQQLVAQLQHDNNVQHDQLHAARFQLQQSQNALTQLDDETRSQSIYSSAFLSGSLSLFLVSVSSGLVLDANSCLFRATGWQRNHVIGRLLTVPYDILMRRVEPSPSERLQRQQQRLLVENERRQMAPARLVQQYKSGRQAIVDVCSGAREQAHSVWRMYVRNGRLCELPGTCWAGEYSDVVEDEGGLPRRRAKHILIAVSFSEVVVVD